MTKAKMIEVIIREAKSSAIVNNKHLDVADIFFTLVFMNEQNLEALCRKMGVYS